MADGELSIADLTKIAFDDVRARQKATADLMIFQDQQAVGLIRLYLTVGLAIASGAIALIGKPETNAIGLGFAFGLAPLIYGVLFSFRAILKTDIQLPGKEPDFWLGAFYNHIDPVEVRYEYMRTEVKRADDNYKINQAAGRELRTAKWCGLSSPFVAILAGLIIVTLTKI